MCFCSYDNNCVNDQLCREGRCYELCKQNNSECYCTDSHDCAQGASCIGTFCQNECPSDHIIPISVGCICGTMSCSNRELCLMLGGGKQCVDKTKIPCTSDFSCSLIEEYGV